jgi:hypothetical protein
MLAAIVDWAALGQVIVFSFAGALLLTYLFTTGVLFVEVEGERAPLARRVAGAVTFGLCAGIVALGLYVMFASK